MPEHFINLNCANCGAKLEVYDDMDRFACGFCGTELLVHRRGGTVALKQVTEAIKQVQIGTDRTAAELALVRLGKEAKKLKSEESEVKSSQTVETWVLGCVLVMFGAIAIGVLNSAGVAGLLAPGVPVCVAAHVLYKRRTKRVATLGEVRRRLEEVKQEIARNRTVVSAVNG